MTNVLNKSIDWHSFGSRSLDELLRKMVWEASLLRESLNNATHPGTNEYACEYHAFNSFVTLWHIHEWIWNDLDKKQKLKNKFKKKSDAQNHFADSCVALQIAWLICNSSKHPGAGNTAGIECSGLFTLVDKEASLFSFQLKIEYQNCTYRAIDLIDQGLAFWIKFCVENEITDWFDEDSVKAIYGDGLGIVSPFFSYTLNQ